MKAYEEAIALYQNRLLQEIEDDERRFCQDHAAALRIRVGQYLFKQGSSFWSSSSSRYY